MCLAAQDLTRWVHACFLPWALGDPLPRPCPVLSFPLGDHLELLFVLTRGKCWDPRGAAVLAAPFLTQLPAHAPGKAPEDGPSAWTPVSHVGDPDGAPGSWLGLPQCQLPQLPGA